MTAIDSNIILAKNPQKLFKIICQYPSRYYLLRHIRHNLYLNCCSIYKSYCIDNCISGNCEKIEKSNHKSSDNNSNTRLPNINQSENAAIINPLPINSNIPAPTLIPLSNIWQIGICDKITYMVNTAHRSGFTLLANIFIHQLSNFHIFQAQRLDIVWSIVCKPKLESTHNLFYKNKKMYLYIAQ